MLESGTTHVGADALVRSAERSSLPSFGCFVFLAVDRFEPKQAECRMLSAEG